MHKCKRTEKRSFTVHSVLAVIKLYTLMRLQHILAGLMIMFQHFPIVW